MTDTHYPPLVYVDPSGTRYRVNGRSSRPVVRIEHQDYTYAYGGGPRCQDCGRPWPCRYWLSDEPDCGTDR